MNEIVVMNSSTMDKTCLQVQLTVTSVCYPYKMCVKCYSAKVINVQTL